MHMSLVCAIIACVEGLIIFYLKYIYSKSPGIGRVLILLI